MGALLGGPGSRSVTEASEGAGRALSCVICSRLCRVVSGVLSHLWLTLFFANTVISSFIHHTEPTTEADTEAGEDEESARRRSRSARVSGCVLILFCIHSFNLLSLVCTHNSLLQWTAGMNLFCVDF